MEAPDGGENIVCQWAGPTVEVGKFNRSLNGKASDSGAKHGTVGIGRQRGQYGMSLAANQGVES